MKFHAPLATVALVSLLLAQPALAQRALDIHARTAGDLADLCGANPKDPAGDSRINYCHGFTQGAVDVQLRVAGDKKPFCFPTPTPSRTATLGEFVSWVRAVPSRRGESALDGFFHFLAERFPCK
jgi:hypothetical protein